ncbi:catechol 2,3-dioxygenase-like lactoylglutathione lyase family enzyme [Nakamurella sp. UYEF19]|uniref:VOC family protein n=1 Tax=Nakamurella sp. UYEF19 TaxID=1756392 RepID=UPI003391EE42
MASWDLGVALRLQAVTFEVADASVAAAFWSGLLDRDLVTESGGAFIPGEETQVGLRFVTSRIEQDGRPRLHVHLTSRSVEDQQLTIGTALRLGGRHLDVGQGADDGFVVLADPAGNELCVIEPGNTYLAGSGYLGEVTCGGTRAVGLFWRDALQWPLVWDEGEQTAIQSPLGGTKISWDSWDESPAGLDNGIHRQRFDLISANPISEMQRLLSLGATDLRELSDHFALADPDGHEFRLYGA